VALFTVLLSLICHFLFPSDLLDLFCTSHRLRSAILLPWSWAHVDDQQAKFQRLCRAAVQPLVRRAVEHARSVCVLLCGSTASDKSDSLGTSEAGSSHTHARFDGHILRAAADLFAASARL